MTSIDMKITMRFLRKRTPKTPMKKRTALKTI
jgi:hypothetical protein